MPLDHPFNQAGSLEGILSRLSTLPQHTWLYISRSVSRITLVTECYATTVNSRDRSPDEQDEFDVAAEQAGMRCFFNRDQLVDIQANLAAQRPDFTLDQLVAAIDFYWKHDAFIDLSTKVT